MKNTPILNKLLLILTLIAMAVLTIQCGDDPEYFTRSEVVTQEEPINTASIIFSGSPNKKCYQINMKMGHDASECTGCVVINGTPTHVPCRGPGDKCTVQSIVAVAPIETHISLIPGQPTNFYNVTSLSSAVLDSLGLFDALRDDDFFLFPDRSFWINGNATDWRIRWMNIPEQYIKRNSDDGLLYYERVSFTSAPLYDNN
jgi:hypothetical protein